MTETGSPAGERPIQVWAPLARRVELETRAGRQSLTEGPGGWFSARDPLPPGTDYRFVLDGGEPLPDPRSPWQPEGVAGPSRTVDPGAFDWTDHTWRGPEWRGSVVYELHVGTFTAGGTFDAAIERLDHLVDLGVTLVELMPIAQAPGRWGWGYDGVLLFAPHHAYGGPDGLDRFVDAAHAHGLGVLLDVVYNHLGPQGNHLSRFGPYFSERHHTPWGPAVNLDGPGSAEVRRFFIDNARHWLATHHFDGLRLDAVHALVDTSAFTFLEELSREMEGLAAHLRRSLVLVAESNANNPYLSIPRDAGGAGLHGQWNDDVHHAIHVALTGEHAGYYADFTGLTDLVHCYREGFAQAGQISPSSGARRGRPLPHRDGSRLVGFVQNHDQVGNRAHGERLEHLVGTDAGMVAAALVLFAPFPPLIFQGEEWAASSFFPYFADFDDPDLVAAVREGRRREFAEAGWSDAAPDPFDPLTVERATLQWGERHEGHHARVLAWYRDLLGLRRSWPELSDGRLDRVGAEADPDAGLFVAQRGRLQLVAAARPGPLAVPVGDEACIVLSSRADPGIEAGVLRLVGPSAVVVSHAALPPRRVPDGGELSPSGPAASRSRSGRRP